MALENPSFGEFGSLSWDVFFTGDEAINPTDASTAFLLHYSPKNYFLVLNHCEVLLLVHLCTDQAINVVLVSSELEGELLIIGLETRSAKGGVLPFDSVGQELLASLPDDLGEVMLLLSADTA